MTRIDYIDDPDAPAINSVVPSVTCVVRNDSGQVLMLRKSDNHLWAVPGGGHEPGEFITDTVVREVREETGLTVEVTGFVGTYTNPHHVIAYDDGEVRQQFSLCFTGRVIHGNLSADDDEATEVRWVDPSDIQRLDIHPSMRMRIEHALDPTRREPYLG
jgi:8-oxo-dGTP pyrophosphatase MutT (NUDIX family)